MRGWRIRDGGNEGPGQGASCGLKGLAEQSAREHEEEEPEEEKEPRWLRGGETDDEGSGNKTNLLSLQGRPPNGQGRLSSPSHRIKNENVWKVFWIYTEGLLVLRKRDQCACNSYAERKEQGHTEQEFKKCFDTVESVINQT